MDDRTKRAAIKAAVSVPIIREWRYRVTIDDLHPTDPTREHPRKRVEGRALSY